MSNGQAIATFSWDDGHPLDLRIAELFNRYGLSCTFYVPKNNSENLPTLRSADLKALAQDNFDIHSHTLNHVYLSHLPTHQQQSEIVSGKKYVEDSTGAEDHIFCYPGGKYSKSTVELVKEAGFSFARTVDMGFTCAYSSNPYLMPTTAIVAPLTIVQVIKHSLKRFAPMRGFDIHSINKDIINKNFSAEKIVSEPTTPCYHFWGHSWEIDKYNLWEPLEVLIQNLIASNSKIVSNKEFYAQRSGS